MTVGRSVSAKSARMTWRSEWMLRLEKFSKNSLWASSSRNRREKGAKLENEEAPEWKGFQAGVDLCLSAINITNINRIERGIKKQSEKLQNSSNITSILKSREHMYRKCMNMWHAKEIASWARPNPNLPAHNQLHTSKMHDNTVIMLMWCNAWDFEIKSLKPIPKFQQKLNNLEKPQNFSKTPNPRFQNMKCMNMRD